MVQSHVESAVAGLIMRVILLILDLFGVARLTDIHINRQTALANTKSSEEDKYYIIYIPVGVQLQLWETP
jgi:hypothetical protein